MRRRKGIRRSLLLDSSRKRQTSRKRRTRNKFLNIFAGFSFLKVLKKIFKLSVITGVLFIGMTSFLAFAILSPHYDLKKISVATDQSTISSEVIQNISSRFLGKNMFFLRKEDLKSLLRKKFPEIKDINITEKWPSEIKINVEIEPAKYNVFSEESANFSSITNNGIIISNNSSEGLPVIKILQYEKPFSLHKNLISADWLRKIDLAEDLLKHDIKIPVREIKLLMKARELHLITSSESAIWIDLEQPIESQLKKLILAEGKIKLYSKKFNHIDLRIPKQIFWEWQ